MGIVSSRNTHTNKSQTRKMIFEYSEEADNSPEIGVSLTGKGAF